MKTRHILGKSVSFSLLIFLLAFAQPLFAVDYSDSVPVKVFTWGGDHLNVVFGYLHYDGSFTFDSNLTDSCGLTYAEFQQFEGKYMVETFYWDSWHSSLGGYGWDSVFNASGPYNVTGGFVGNYFKYYLINFKPGAVGSLSINLFPAAVVMGGAQWQVDGGAWNNSGATVTNLSIGSHVVSYKPGVYGWTNPPNQTVTVLRNQTTTLTTAYQTNFLAIQLYLEILEASPELQSNTQWQEGSVHTLLAKPTKGFTFQKWKEVASNIFTGLPMETDLTNKTKLVYRAYAPASLYAVFKDVAAPQLKVISPKKKMSTTNGVLTASGTTKDNWKVATVICELQNGGWFQSLAVSSTNAFANWTTPIYLVEGTNTIRIYAKDHAGNCSPTNTSVVVRKPAPFEMIANAIMPPGNPPLQMRLDVQPVAKPGIFAFHLESSANVAGQVEYSDDMVHWNTLTNFSGTNMPDVIQDPSSAESPMRFYRVRHDEFSTQPN